MVLLIGLPIASMLDDGKTDSGMDRGKLISQLKGELAAIELIQINKECKYVKKNS